MFEMGSCALWSCLMRGDSGVSFGTTGVAVGGDIGARTTRIQNTPDATGPHARSTRPLQQELPSTGIRRCLYL